MTTKETVNEQQIKQLIDYYLAGHSLNETVKQFCLKNRSQLKKILQNFNVPIRNISESYSLRSKNLKSKHKLEKLSKIIANGIDIIVCDLYKNGFAFNKIWEQIKQEFNLNLSDDEIKTILKQHSINLRTKTERYELGLEKMQKTNIVKYGNACPLVNKEVRKKANKTIQNKYGEGIINPFSAEEVKNKIKQTNLQRYGTENAAQSDLIKEKVKCTNTEKYGTEYGFQASEVKEKIRQTFITKYGVEHPLSQKYCYENESFDSFPELCFYLYNIEQNVEIKRSNKKLEYSYNNIVHNYFPDFEIDSTLIELKGPQFLKEDGTWQNPFDHSLDELFEAKHKCAQANNVKILYQDDYQKYVDWFYNKEYKKETFLGKERQNG